MSEKFLSNLTALKTALATDGDNGINAEKIGLLARALRWQPNFDAEELAALLKLGEFVQGKRGDGYWEVERAVYEILCDHAVSEHLPFLVKAYHLRGTHADDRRRLALQGLSRLAALTGNVTALDILVDALSHNKADTRGWAIGFLTEAYFALRRPLPETVTARLRDLAKNDPSEDVRAEATNIINHQMNQPINKLTN